jgi:antitoxin component of RelBE/YafQ-DinJ toxin-antitoxin module
MDREPIIKKKFMGVVVSPDLKRRAAKECKRRNITFSELLRIALERELEDGAIETNANRGVC